MRKEPYYFSTKINFIDSSKIIEFAIVTEHLVFLKQLLQILGMYNYIVHDKQNIWQNKEAFITMTAPNGDITLRIGSDKKITLSSNENQSALLNIELILTQFSVFRKINMVLPEVA